MQGVSTRAFALAVGLMVAVLATAQFSNRAQAKPETAG